MSCMQQLCTFNTIFMHTCFYGLASFWCQHHALNYAQLQGTVSSTLMHWQSEKHYSCTIRGLAFSSEGGGSKIYKKSMSKKLRPPILAAKKLCPPHHRYNLPQKQAKIVSKSVFLNKINTLSMVILWLPTPFRRKCQSPNYN